MSGTLEVTVEKSDFYMPSWEEWQSYPLNLPYDLSTVDLSAYNKLLAEKNTTIFCDEDDDLNINVIDVPGEDFLSTTIVECLFLICANMKD